MSYNILFNNDPFIDHLCALTYINELTKNFSEKRVLIDDTSLFSVLTEMQMEFPHIDGLDKASAFKKAGRFLTAFIAESPIKSSFDADKIGEDLSQLSNHANIMVGLQIAIDSLDGASVCRNGDNPITLQRIAVSKHTYIDLIEALHSVTLQSHYKIITVLLEQLVYKTNPNAQYEVLDI